MTTYKKDRHKSLLPLIDGDILTYRLGFAADAGAKREAPETWREQDYLHWALHLVDNQMKEIKDKFDGNGEHILYLSGKTNFRDNIATIKPYKGNRDQNKRPKYYAELRDYMVAEWGAVVSAGCEADDLMGIKQFSNPDKSTVICTIDKDLKMIPGYHYNFVKGEFNDVKLREANRFFFRQVLTGDATDNIPGIPGIGDKTAIKLTAHLDTDEEYFDVIYGQYRKAYPETCQETISEIARLLWIMRRDNEDCPYVQIFQDGLSG